MADKYPPDMSPDNMSLKEIRETRDKVMALRQYDAADSDRRRIMGRKDRTTLDNLMALDMQHPIAKESQNVRNNMAETDAEALEERLRRAGH